jgi:hypothetical protein
MSVRNRFWLNVQLRSDSALAEVSVDLQPPTPAFRVPNSCKAATVMTTRQKVARRVTVGAGFTVRSGCCRHCWRSRSPRYSCIGWCRHPPPSLLGVCRAEAAPLTTLAGVVEEPICMLPLNMANVTVPALEIALTLNRQPGIAGGGAAGDCTEAGADGTRGESWPPLAEDEVIINLNSEVAAWRYALESAIRPGQESTSENLGLTQGALTCSV